MTLREEADKGSKDNIKTQVFVDEGNKIKI